MSNDPQALRPGAAIAGYNILRVLGAGGFGITYEADSPFTGKHVAIKEFFPRGIASRESNTRIIYAQRDMEVVQWALKRFESSTLDQCKLKHSNIVDVIHYVKDNGTGYMIMEYVEGETLEHWLRQRKNLPSPDELRPLLEPVLAALEYLHTKKIIHRDIAPDNIMVRPDGQPMIIDFGAIKLIEQETQIRSRAEKSFMVAKQFYSPPEQIDAEGELDRRADIYATGAVLYRAFAGQPPVSAEERMQKLAFGKADPIKPIASLAPHLPNDIAVAIDRALSFNAENRPRTVGELRASLGWSDSASLAPTLPIARMDAAPKPEVHSAEKRSRLPWLLPVAGIAAIAVIAAFTGGLVSLPKFESKIVNVPVDAPKMDAPKVVPQMQVHTPPEVQTSKEDADKKVDEAKKDQPAIPQQQKQDQALLPPAMICPPGQEELNGKCVSPTAVFPKWYTGEVQFYRAVPTDPSQALTSCVPGRRIPLIILVEDQKLRISQAGNTYFVDIKPDGKFSFQGGFNDANPGGNSLLRKVELQGTITPQKIEATYIATMDRGACFGTFAAIPTVNAPPTTLPAPDPAPVQKQQPAVVPQPAKQVPQTQEAPKAKGEVWCLAFVGVGLRSPDCRFTSFQQCAAAKQIPAQSCNRAQ